MAERSGLWWDEDGLTSVEYALLLVIVVVAGLVAWRGLGVTVHNSAASSSAQLANTATG